ncbi:hypothetical protein [Ochrobactrum sp. BTU1]|jgi:putative Mg2+ transporter-C (MgtC) family protein|uniref:hypothetical protein n=1 Tax=Ochrobactrum sp. BTU1 TaxID=2840456 RepID=UPI00207B606B
MAKASGRVENRHDGLSFICKVTIVSLELANVRVFDDQNIRVEPSRLAEAIISGVAFLATGFIIFGKGQITGNTTGAGM